MTDFDFTKLFDPEFHKTLEKVTPDNLPLVGDLVFSSSGINADVSWYADWMDPLEWGLTHYYLHKVPRPVTYEPGTAVVLCNFPGRVQAIRTRAGVWESVDGIRYTDKEAKNLIDDRIWKLALGVFTEIELWKSSKKGPL